MLVRGFKGIYRDILIALLPNEFQDNLINDNL